MLERFHLLVIREIERQGSLTAAATTLHLTQSALSHTVKKLEQQMGAPIWDREGRSLRLTQAGRYLLGLANRLLPQFEHAEARMKQYADGERGTLRIGMECAPCYQWLLKVVSPYLSAWPDVDVDVKQRFQFGGIGALLGYDIDVLVTPDPLMRPGLRFDPVFDYEQVLVVSEQHRLANVPHVEPDDLVDQTLLAYPVETDRLDIYNYFLRPANTAPRRHKTIETTDIMLQMVASNRGVAALPRWLAEEYADRMPLVSLKLGRSGIAKQIFLGTRETDAGIDYLRAFVELARDMKNSAPRVGR
ncbi:LysR family transcriptional regulator [Trinickia dinghuensis]|uniref:HTH-type transcriptional regulator MetR n=1 Tax=Trinickia dinghuensis TaxID=2291023 RepID=A0A3D8JXN7_9BURK|nr:LysR family transcriptional regulator [Trinickia dinghuensis]RDU97406.1 LysR family transcriptional regulator [Trinickia dinghuensis]